jgi:transcriptional regulator with PAS, ATPase and Fis domain
VISYYYFNKYSKLFNKKFIGVENGVWEYLCKYDWPGNMRELQNAIEFMVNMLDENGIISMHYIPEIIHEKVKLTKNYAEDESLNLKKVESETIKRALSIYSSSKKGKQAAADVLGIGIATLYRKIDEYNL